MASIFERGVQQVRKIRTAAFAFVVAVAAAMGSQPSAGAEEVTPTTITTAPRVVDADHPVSKIGDRVPIASLQRRQPHSKPVLATLAQHGDAKTQGGDDSYQTGSGGQNTDRPVGSSISDYDPINDCRAALGGQAGSKVVNRFQYCSVKKWSYSEVVVPGGEVVGTVSYVQTTAGQAPQDRREIYYQVNLGFWDIKGTVDDNATLEVTGISSGYNGTDGSNQACGVINSASNAKSLGAWRANGNAVASIVFDQDKSLGYGRDFVSRCGVATTTCVGSYCGEFTDASTSIRFDSASYLEGVGGGVFDATTPTLFYEYDSPAHGAVTDHIHTAYGSPDVTDPKITGKSVPGWGGRPLTRLYEGWNESAKRARARNEAAKNAACTPIKPANSAGLDCDEFPFGSTFQGAGFSRHFSVRYLSLSQNRSAGGTLAGFYKKERILHQGSFTVMLWWKGPGAPPDPYKPRP
ncbi:NucA/NucB deoxyribonuclease domain-containing protein [Streptomyces sp. NPDC056524]|uniref:NucA/NucB deoxyribonuclease domain-containing protein n=1 Tax=Streptomyces sp. NPDC056524 TaxID=3345851 RepID=UPI0036885A9F